MRTRSPKPHSAGRRSTSPARRGTPDRKTRKRPKPARPKLRRREIPWALFLAWLLAAALFGLLVAGSCNHAHAAMSSCLDATCRISTPDGGRGSGCVFEIGQGYVYVITAAHVVGSYSEVSCEFWRDGHQSTPVPGQVILRAIDRDADAATVALRQEQFGEVLPAVVPLAPRTYAVRPGETLLSAGCARGAWSTGWKGHALGYRGSDLYFTPAPAQGRSGSALFDADGRQIVGIVRARTTDDQAGIACSLQALYAGLGTAAAARQVQCGPEGCVPPYRALPYRQKLEYQQWRQQDSERWPTMPPAASPPVDLGPVTARLDAITAQMQRDQRQAAKKEEQSPSAAIIAVLFIAALVIGGVGFFATQSHTG